MPTITQLPVASSVGATDDFVIVQSSVTKQVTGSLVAAFVGTGIMITESQVIGLTADLASKLAKASNLSDLTSVPTARTNLGLGSAALLNTPITSPDGGTGVASPTTNTLPVAQGTSPFTFVGPLADGQVLIGSTGTIPVAANIMGSGGISVVNTAGGIAISGTGGGISWTEVLGLSQSLVADNGYVTNNAALVTLTLPATAAFGSAINILGKGAGGWTIAQGAGQSVQVGNLASTVGAGGSVSSTNRYDSLQLICTTANTGWTVLGAPQSAGLTIV